MLSIALGRNIYYYMQMNRKHFGCIVDGCKRPHGARKLCRMHYIRWRIQGENFDRGLYKEGDPRNIPGRIEAMSMPIPESGCIVWTGNLNGYGYARIEIDGKPVAVHRLAYEYAFGPIPDGLFICHKCDVRSCINPNHLFAGTPAENVKDRDRKGRHRAPRGETSGYNKLKEKDVKEIRASSKTNQELAIIYDVSRAAIRAARIKKTWAHID